MGGVAGVLVKKISHDLSFLPMAVCSNIID